MNDDLSPRDGLDDMLRDYFKPADTPGALATRIVRSSLADAGDLAEFAGRLAIDATGRGVSLVRTGEPREAASAEARQVVARAREEIAEYLAGRRVFFSVPVDLSAAPEFQRDVLEAARLIPFGEARPYAWVAERIGNPRAVRAVGTALGRNPVPLIVPCHRVWRTDGGLGGYLFGTALKERLLNLERHTPVIEGSSATRVVCRLGCARSRRTRPEHRVVFASVADARSVGYRPCPVCRPPAR